MRAPLIGVSENFFFIDRTFCAGFLDTRSFFYTHWRSPENCLKKVQQLSVKKIIPFKCASFIDEPFWIVLDMLWRHFTSKYPGDVSLLPHISFTINKKACLYLWIVIGLKFRWVFTYTIPHTPIHSRTHTPLIHTHTITHSRTQTPTRTINHNIVSSSHKHTILKHNHQSSATHNLLVPKHILDVSDHTIYRDWPSASLIVDIISPCQLRRSFNISLKSKR